MMIGDGQRVLETKSSRERAEILRYYCANKSSMAMKMQFVFNRVLEEAHYEETAIDLRFANLQKIGALHLVRVLPYYTQLTTLKLWKTCLGPEGLEVLKGALPGLKLEILSIEDNGLGPIGAKILASAFTHLKHLKELWIQINSIGPEGAEAVSSELHLLRNLEVLALDENDLGDGGAGQICLSLASLLSLKSIYMTSNFLSRACVMDLIIKVKTLKTLSKVNLRGNLSPEEAEELKELVKNGVVSV
jgi:Ran GTPase-activating protein (RanGAP) involved in mRNA processing and transport